jgi:hypothetical protein
MTTDTPVAADELLVRLGVNPADVSPARRENLARALALGASEVTIARLANATRVNRKATIVLPAHRYEGLSRGRGWARQGRGERAVWGERCDTGYRVGPGRWSVGATDGFRRKDATTWTVAHVQVGSETWTVAD